MAIPLVLHQMWRDDALPDRWAKCRETWKRHHPHWEHHLWTDRSLRDFVATQAPNLLEIYDAYPSAVMRADLTRYLLLQHFGGVYADLDTECLRPLEPLLSGERLLLPLEPEIHTIAQPSVEYGQRRIVGNAWMASEPGHPFWNKVMEEISQRRHHHHPLVATGPFLLSDLAGRLSGEEQPKLLPSATVYPATNLDLEWLDLREPGSPHWYGPSVYAIHYWEGTWWRKQRNHRKMHLLSSGEPVLTGWYDHVRAGTNRLGAAFNPLVSCLMVTGRRPRLAALAIQAFLRQTYPHKELVIIDDSQNDELTSIIDDAGSSIRWIKVPAENKPLGALRNMALAEARGELLCQWDDDDLSSPLRIEKQVRSIGATGADACCLARLQLWWPARDWFAMSNQRLWECALMWRKGTIPAYPELRSGEDTPAVRKMAAGARVAMLDAPSLYTYICHGRNTFADDHWQKFWSAAQWRATGQACRLKLQLMQGPLPCHEYLEALDLPGLTSDESATVRHDAAPSVSAASVSVPQVTTQNRSLPKILIATPLKDAAPFLDGFWNNLFSTDYPADKLSVAFLESDSRDATVAHTQSLLNRHSGHFARTKFLSHNFGFQPQGPRWEPRLQRTRRAILARSRNQLLESALQDEEWVLWIDADLVSWPADIIHRLINEENAIMTPHCVRAPSGPSFDLNTFVFRDRDKQDGEEHRVDDIFQPPPRVTRLYLESFRGQKRVTLDSVGGTMLMVPADLHRDGLRFPARPYRGYLETEGLAMMARDLGVACIGLPNIEVVHS